MLYRPTVGQGRPPRDMEDKMKTAEQIKAGHAGDYAAWMAQATVYGLPTDDATFAAWWNAVEQTARANEMARR